MAARKPTHLRCKMDGVSLPDGVHREDDVVAIEGLDFSNPATADHIVELCKESGNTYEPLETGVLDDDGNFVPVPEPKSEEASEPAES
jgi:hypothetical protein